MIDSLSRKRHTECLNGWQHEYKMTTLLQDICLEMHTQLLSLVMQIAKQK